MVKLLKSKMVRLLEKIDPKPVRVEIQPTGKCNLDCRFCDSATGKDLETETWISFIEQALKKDVERISVTGGGEPLLRPDVISEISKIAADKEISGDIVTNGSFFPDDLIERLVRDEWDFISMSIHSPKAETCDLLRNVKGSFKKTIQNARKINEMKEKYNNSKPHLNFIYVITKQNQDQIIEAARLCQDIGFSSMIFRIVEGKENSIFYPDDMESIKKQLDFIKKNTDLGINTHFDEDTLNYSNEDDVETNNQNSDKVNNKKILKEPYCYTPFFEVVIFPDGRVAPCCTFHASDNLDSKMPNIVNKDFNSIWNNELEYFRKTMYGEGKLPMPCKTCTMASSHKGDSWKEYIESGQSEYA